MDNEVNIDKLIELQVLLKKKKALDLTCKLLNN